MADDYTIDSVTYSSKEDSGSVQHPDTVTEYINGSSQPERVSASTPLPVGGTWVLSEDDAHTTGDSGIMLLAVRKDTAATTAGTDGDYAALISDNTGRLRVNVYESSRIALQGSTDVVAAAAKADQVRIGSEVLSIKTANIDLSASGTIVAAVASKRLQVLGLFLHADTDPGKVTVNDGSGGTALLTTYPGANGGVVLPGPTKWCDLATTNTALYLTLGSSVSIGGVVTYAEVTP